MITSRTKDKLRNSLIIPTAMSGIEVIASLHPKINFDWKDIACYYGAALSVYCVDKALSSFLKKDEKIKDIELT